MASTRTITYNDFEFPFSRMNVEETPEYAEDGFTQIGTTYVFTVAGHMVVSGTVGEFKTTMNAMRSRLAQPRSYFKVEQGDGVNATEQLFYFDAARSDDWGPLPGRLSISNIAVQSFSYEWSIRCYKKEKWAGNEILDSENILSFQRRYSFAIDQDGYTTRTISGTLHVSARATPADSYRNVAAPECPAWFERVSQTYDQSDDARTLTFTIVDKERTWTLPEGITTGQASFHIHQENNAVIRMTLSGWFACPIDTWKPNILTHIRNLMEQKFPDGPGGVQFFDTFDLTDDIYDNKISFTVSGQMGGALNRDVMGVVAGFGERPPDTTGSATIANPYGGHGTENSGVMAADAIIYDASGTQTFPSANIKPGGSPAAVEAGSKTDGSWNPVSLPDGISDEQKNSPYIAYHDVVSYEIDNGRVVLCPKSPGNPIILQVHAPKLTIIQAGYAVRVAKSNKYWPQAPNPVYSGADAAFLQSYISPASEEIINEAWSKWTIHWRYVMVAKKSPTAANNPMLAAPLTPQRKDQTVMFYGFPGRGDFNQSPLLT